MTRRLIVASSAQRGTRLYTAREIGGAEVDIRATSLQRALRSAVEWTRDGSYDPDITGPIVQQRVWVWCEATGERDECAVEIRVAS